MYCPFVQCGAGAKCFLEIRTGEGNILLANYSSTNPVPASKTVIFYSTFLSVKFTATDPAVRFMATWVCAKGKWTK
jgi:hypothetical protein